MSKRIGIEWVEDYHGLASDLRKSQKRAEGFYYTLSGTRVFNFGNDIAWDQDFEELGLGFPSLGIPITGTDTYYADNVDIVYFAGHGSPDAFYFGVHNRDNGEASWVEMALGRLCKWLIVDSCLLLADGAMLKWPHIFKGLRMMLGFRTRGNDEGNRGRYFAQYLNLHRTMYWSWIWACQETADADTEWACIHALSPSSSYYDTWEDGRSPIPNPKCCYHSGAC